MIPRYLYCSLHGTGWQFLEQQLLLILQMHLHLPGSSSPLHLQVGHHLSSAQGLLHPGDV